MNDRSTEKIARKSGPLPPDAKKRTSAPSAENAIYSLNPSVKQRNIIKAKRSQPQATDAGNSIFGGGSPGVFNSSITNFAATDHKQNDQVLVPQSPYYEPCARIPTQNVGNPESFDYMSMDVDLDASQGPPPSPESKGLILIPDTNVWVGNQEILGQILKQEFYDSNGDHVPLRIMIPWMVLQEVDHTIHRNKSDPGFRNAAKYIHGLLSSKNPKVKGQKATEAVIGIEFNELMADDSILNCAIQCAKAPLCQTVFITNDINLLNKALVHDITSFKADKELLNRLRQLVRGNKEELFPQKSPSTIPSVSNLSPQPPSLEVSSSASLQVPQVSSMQTLPLEGADDEIDNSMEIDDPMGISYSNPSIPTRSETTLNDSSSSTNISEPVTFEAVISAIQKALTNVIVLKMVEEYGQEGWRMAIKIKPPFTLESALKCLQVHWIAVFSFLFSSRAKVALDELVEILKKEPTSRSEGDITIKWRLEVAQMTMALLSMMDNSAKRPRVLECCQLLQSFVQSFKNS